MHWSSADTPNVCHLFTYMSFRTRWLTISTTSEERLQHKHFTTLRWKLKYLGAGVAAVDRGWHKLAYISKSILRPAAQVTCGLVLCQGPNFHVINRESKCVVVEYQWTTSRGSCSAPQWGFQASFFFCRVFRLCSMQVPFLLHPSMYISQLWRRWN